MFEYNDDVKDASLQALMSGGVGGAIFGTGAGLLSAKKPSLISLLKAAGIGAGIGGGVSGGSTLIGSSLLGAPDEEDSTAFTKRSALGGALLGGGVGALAGGIASRYGVPKGAPGILKEYFTKLKNMPFKDAVGKGAGAGLLAAIPAGYHGYDEGIGTDFVNNVMRERKRKKMEEEAALNGV